MNTWFSSSEHPCNRSSAIELLGSASTTLSHGAFPRQMAREPHLLGRPNFVKAALCAAQVKSYDCAGNARDRDRAEDDALAHW